MFQRRHYEFLANFLKREIEISRDMQDLPRQATIEGLTRLLASELSWDNFRFERGKFLEASGVE